ncbi:MAG: hypothetical protein VYE62_02960, partial [Pseudomonadota bacterium]|nr:hypothetical protein [Pseudomonadota bacterium]
PCDFAFAFPVGPCNVYKCFFDILLHHCLKVELYSCNFSNPLFFTPDCESAKDPRIYQGQEFYKNDSS